MKKSLVLFFILLALIPSADAKSKKQQLFPDGTPIPVWFSDTTDVDISKLGKQYVITEYGVKNDSNIVQTEAIQHVIDLAAGNGGGVIVIPQGTFLTGSIFFKQGTHLYISEGGTIKGIDDISY